MTLTTAYTISFRLDDGQRYREVSATLYQKTFVVDKAPFGFWSRLQQAISTRLTVIGIIARSVVWGVCGG